MHNINTKLLVGTRKRTDICFMIIILKRKAEAHYISNNNVSQYIDEEVHWPQTCTKGSQSLHNMQWWRSYLTYKLHCYDHARITICAFILLLHYLCRRHVVTMGHGRTTKRMI